MSTGAQILRSHSLILRLVNTQTEFPDPCQEDQDSAWTFTLAFPPTLPKPQLLSCRPQAVPIHDPCPALPGEMTTLQTLDREQQSSYQLLVQVQDGGNPPRSTTGTVHIAVLDLNDNSPTFLQASGAAGGGLPIQVCEVAGPCP